MDWIDNILRQRALAGTATVTLTTGTANPLYPVSNLYSGRLAIPFRTTSKSIVIDIDFGAASPPAVAVLLIMGHNFTAINATDINVKGGNTFPPSTLDSNISPYGVSDNISDFYGHQHLYWSALPIGATYRYYRITLTQAERQADFTQIGQLWFEPSGDYSWYALGAGIGSRVDSVSWPGQGEASLERNRGSNPRALDLEINASHAHLVGDAALGSLLESRVRNRTLAYPFNNSTLGESRGLTFRTTYQENWSVSERVGHLFQSCDGDGRVV